MTTARSASAFYSARAREAATRYQGCPPQEVARSVVVLRNHCGCAPKKSGAELMAEHGNYRNRTDAAGVQYRDYLEDQMAIVAAHTLSQRIKHDAMVVSVDAVKYLRADGSVMRRNLRVTVKEAIREDAFRYRHYKAFYPNKPNVSDLPYTEVCTKL